MASLQEKLNKIKSPKLQNQHHTSVVLSAVEDTLRDQHADFTATAYFAALLALLGQAVSSTEGIVNKELATSIVYLLDTVAPFVPAALLVSKFSQILTSLAPALTLPEAEAPLLKSSVGCLQSLLVAQDAAAWALPSTQIGPRRAMAGLMTLAVDHRPKVRKRVHDALVHVVRNPPPSPSLDHPAADMCAGTALHTLGESVAAAAKAKKGRHGQQQTSQHEPMVIHAVHLVKTIATASGGWPTKKIEPLCELLMNVSKSSNEYLTMAAFEVFEIIFEGMADDFSSSKLPRLMEAISELKPAQNDLQLLPPWIAVLSRGYDVSAQVNPEETFENLPHLFDLISPFLASSSRNIRVSASECLISFLVNCIPDTVILEPSVYDEKVFEKLAKICIGLLSIKYQAAWMEVFNVLAAMFDALKWRAFPILTDIVRIIGELRGNESFASKKQADQVLGSAIAAMGPEAVLEILPLNIAHQTAGQPGRVWLLPILRDHVSNTRLSFFRSEFVPLSEALFQRVLEYGNAEKTVEVKIFETLVQQTWAILPGFCELPLDLTESFDQSFAELLSNVLYKQTELRVDVCKALQNLVESNQAITSLDTEQDDLILQRRIAKADAKKNIAHLASFSSNILAVLFNVYSQTLPQFRGFLLRCINAYLSITGEQKKSSDTQLIKKAYKLIPRLATTENGAASLRERSPELQSLIVATADQTPAPARRDRLLAIHEIVSYLPTSDLHFIPSVLPEVVLGCKESNEKARTAAFSLLIHLAQRTIDPDLNPAGTVIRNSLVPHMPNTAPDAPATIEEFFTMVSAGLAGSSPHMVAASVTALSRLLFEFHSKLPPAMLSDLVQTIDIFLASNNREIVRSVLGFVKVAVVALPEDMLRPRLDSLVPNLLVWSKEHKGRLKSKVKGILERLIRRFGSPLLEGLVGEADRKFVVAIRKERERRKRKKTQAKGGEGGDGEGEGDERGRDAGSARKGATTTPGHRDHQPPRGGEKSFSNEFDKAVYGSDMSESDSAFATTDSDDASEIDVDEQGNMHVSSHKSSAASRKQQQQQRGGGGRQKPSRPGLQSQTQYIRELSPESNPLDLLAPDALASISTTKPSVRFLATKTRKRAARVNADGKLLLGLNGDGDGDGDVGMAGGGNGSERAGAGETEGADGVNAYLSAVSGPDAVRRGQRGRLKVSQGRRRGGDEMEIDDDGGVEVAKAIGKEMKGGWGGSGRRSLGVEKVRGESGRVEKRGSGRGGRFSGGGRRGGRGQGRGRGHR
ncbi:pre-rRNA processing protein Rrp12 [Histoplasma capsulatum H143]|uniref:Pre-rRNA processing protein Rrp12 n=1 Tax=Ajellomyces capsulatus (strain H143) TaxID=544712 RepID=C6HK84_AJECH|nr:pre-rRNA processing protein Rrp12 [Histoplasma capsulatum H143]